MDDNALKNYGLLHKANPFIFPLVFQESQDRQHMRNAQQMQGGQEQPKVVDQALAQMAPQQLPEDQGIGQLNAGDMNFAGGGIIAFADGGDVERYAPGGLFETDPAKLRAMAEQRLRMEQLRAGRLAPGGPYSSLPAATAQSSGSMLRSINPAGVAGYGFGLYHGDLNEGEAAELERRRAMAPTVDAQIQTATFSPEESRAMLNQAEQPARVNPAVYSAPAPAAPKADTGRKAPGAGPSAAAAAAGPRAAAGSKQPAQAGLGDLATTYADILKKQDFKDPAEARLGALEKKELAAAEEAKAALLRDQAKFDDAYKGREKRLSDRELDIGKQKDTNMGLAFLNAGLAIMSTPGGLATAIGKGAQVGTAQFAAGLDKIRSAQERLDEARDKMEDLKLNRAEMSAKEIRAAEKDIRSVGIDAEKRGIDGIRMAADVNRKTADTMFKAAVDVGVNRERIAAERENTLIRERGATARNRNTQLEVLEAVSKDPRLAAAYQSMHGKGEDVMGQYNDFLKANPILAQDPQQAVTQFLMTKSVFSQIGKPTVTDKPSTNVRTQP
jgi:hypothetical protein